MQTELSVNIHLWKYSNTKDVKFLFFSLIAEHSKTYRKAIADEPFSYLFVVVVLFFLSTDELEQFCYETSLLTKCGEFSNLAFQALIVGFNP
ncbi:hypothetical protein [Nostoc sp.]|uniref:hypothetical protein n=1 Tax=Nostoc sp. TaxID=1180 RepID=UPI002FFC4F8A